MGRERPRTLQRRTYPACCCDVVFLNEHATVEAEPVIVAAAAAHGVLFEGAESRMGFARIDYPGAATLDRINIAPGGRSDSAHQLREIQCHSFTNQQSCEPAMNLRHDRAARQSKPSGANEANCG